MEQPHVTTSTELDMSLDVETLIRRDLPHYLKQAETLDESKKQQAMDTLLVEIAGLAMTDRFNDPRTPNIPSWWEGISIPALKKRLADAVAAGDTLESLSLSAIIYVRETLL